MTDFKKPIKLFIRENKSKDFISVEFMRGWYLQYANFQTNPTYIGVFMASIKIYLFKTTNKGKIVYVFNWDKILKELRIKGGVEIGQKDAR